jgi:transposase
VDHLDDITIERLQSALEEVSGKKATQRLTVAIAYKNGITQTELADWYDVERKTIYNWLTRLDTDAIETAVTDADRPGRDRKLSGAAREAFERTVREPPTAVGVEEPCWTPALVREYLGETYDVDYSVSSCRRLLRQAGLQYHRPPQDAGHAEPHGGGSTDEESGLREGVWTPIDE